jgi:hypothetical protein
VRRKKHNQEIIGLLTPIVCFPFSLGNKYTQVPIMEAVSDTHTHTMRAADAAAAAAAIN